MERDSITKLEEKKLQLEIRTLEKPFRSNPAYWISGATTLLAITALFFQYRLSRNEFILAETKSVQAKIETEKAQENTKRLTEDVRRLEQEIAEKSKRREQLEALVRNADSLLSKAQTTTNPELRSEIETLRETTKPSSPFWSSLPALLDQPEIKESANVQRVLSEANNQISRVRSDILASELKGFSTSQTGYAPDYKNKRFENHLAFTKPGYFQPLSYTKYVMQIIGNELRLSWLEGDKEILFYTTSASQPVFDKNFEEAVRRSIEPQLQAELKRTD
jgi:hypothetical protein